MGIIRRIEWWVLRRRAERAERRQLIERELRELAATWRRVQASPRCGVLHPEIPGVACQEPRNHPSAVHIDRRGGAAIAWQATGFECCPECGGQLGHEVGCSRMDVAR